MKTDWVVINAENRPVTTSRMVSEVFGESHKNIVAKILAWLNISIIT